VVRYVGQTTQHFAVRYLSHLSPGKYDTTRRAHWLRALVRDRVAPDMVLLEQVGHPDALNDRELYWICALKEQYGMADLNADLPRWYLAGEPRPKRLNCEVLA
jgi:hypothetical protein